MWGYGGIRIDWDADYVYTVSHHQSNGNNATNIYNSAVKNGQEEDLLRSVDYLSQSPFVIDWDNENSTTINSAFYIIPIKYPDKFKRMGVFRYMSLTPLRTGGKKKPRPGLFLIFYAGNTFTLAFPFCFIEDDFT